MYLYTYNVYLRNQDARVNYQDMLSVYADDAEKDRERWCEQQSGVLKGVSQREDAGTDVTLEQMHHGFQVPAVVQLSISAFDLFSTRSARQIFRVASLPANSQPQSVHTCGCVYTCEYVCVRV